jgi:hypothetical protein
MENKTTAIVATLITTLLCGIPGLTSLCLGVVITLAGPVFDTPNSDLLLISAFVCLGIIFITIPIVVGILTFRKRPSKTPKFNPDEPIPPPS